LQERFGFPVPRYGHLPVVRNAAGEKLSKQTVAPPVDARPVGEVLREVFHYLGLPPSTVSEPQAALEEAIGAWKSQLQGNREGGHFDAFAPGTVTE
jgi:glutamyl-Q tRNA(Asp) synthetase